MRQTSFVLSDYPGKTSKSADAPEVLPKGKPIMQGGANQEIL
jgi:hypothetical protein